VSTIDVQMFRLEPHREQRVPCEYPVSTIDVQMFRLEPHRDTLVGSADENIRGISGGERKVSTTARW
jgi:hypothetical protein